MEQLTFLSAERPARISASPGFGRALLASTATSHSSFFVWLHEHAPAGWSGRTSPVSCHRTADGRLEPSSGGLAELGYGTAYRVLDAQYFGLAQRRARVFVVAHSGDWRRAAAVLFERASLHGDHPPRREAGEEVANSLVERPDRGGGNSEGQRLIAGAVSSKWAKGTGGPAGDECYNLTLAHSLRADGFDASEDGTGRGTPLVAHAFNWQSGGDMRGLELRESTSAMSREQTPAVAFHQNQRAEVTTNDTTGALNSGGGKPGQGYPAAMLGSAVRRLTPRECERLQGFPDDYTLIPWRKGMAPDGSRYKALGNSMAVPVMRWLGERIAMVEALP